MENNQTDFLKNRPVAATANQYKDVYGSQKSSTRKTITGVLIFVMLIFVIISIFTGNYITLSIFGFWLALLIVSIFIGRHADKSKMPVKPVDSPEAIFKEHEE